MSPDVSASIRARLLAIAKHRREEFERTLARFAAERLLFRIGASAARGRCILKGASLLSVWLPDPYRATRDVDLLSFGLVDEEAVRALFEQIDAVSCPEDGLRFDLSAMRIEAIRAQEEHAGMRARLVSYLGNARIPVQVDFGVGDAGADSSQDVDYPTILDHLPAPRLRAYSREASVAEKFEVMVELDMSNSRMKDFHDIWALSTLFAFEGPRLRGAVTDCFERRSTPWTAETPGPLTPEFYESPQLASRWTSYLTAGAILTPPPARFGDIGERIICFLGPVRASILTGVPFECRWSAGGAWLAHTKATEGGEREA